MTITKRPKLSWLWIGTAITLVIIGWFAFSGSSQPDSYSLPSPFAVKEIDRSSKTLIVYAFPNNCGAKFDSYESATVSYTPTQVVVHVSVSAPKGLQACAGPIPPPHFVGTVTLQEPIGNRLLVDGTTGNPPLDFLKANE